MSITGEELDHNLAFPLPYCIFLLIVLGILGWAINLQSLNALGIDPIAAMDLCSDTNASTSLTCIRPLQSLGTFYISLPHIYHLFNHVLYILVLVQFGHKRRRVTLP